MQFTVRTFGVGTPQINPRSFTSHGSVSVKYSSWLDSSRWGYLISETWMEWGVFRCATIPPPERNVIHRAAQTWCSKNYLTRVEAQTESNWASFSGGSTEKILNKKIYQLNANCLLVNRSMGYAPSLSTWPWTLGTPQAHGNLPTRPAWEILSTKI